MSHVTDLAHALTDARARPEGVALPEELGLTDAYRVQADAFAQRAQALAGWKIGVTGTGIRQALGAEEPTAGRLAISDIVRAPVSAITIGDARETYVEGELVFEMARALLPQDAPFSPEQVAQATGALHVGIEIVTSRFVHDDLPLGLLIADNCMADRLFIGDRIADGWDDRFAALPVVLSGPGAHRREGATADVFGNPLLAVTWLANWLAGQGLALEPGQWVSSGTCTGVTPVKAGDRVSVDLGGLGSATVEFVSE